MKKRKVLSYADSSIIQYYKTVNRALNDYENKMRGVLKLGTLTRLNFIEAVKRTLAPLTLTSSVVSIKHNEKRSKATLKVNKKATMFKYSLEDYERMCGA